jgi:hypothetical protein
MRCRFTHITLFTGAMLTLSPVLFAGPSTAKAQGEAARGARLLKSVAADARQIRTAAVGLEKLTKDSAATWTEYDRQWNEIQPVVEAMRGKIARLEAIEASLPANEKQALDQSKTDFQKLAWHSRELGILVDKVPADLSTPKFKTASRDLVKEAGDMAQVAKNGI